MKRQTITLFLLALLAFSSAQADDLYASVSYGQVRLDNDVLDDSAEYDNIGFTIGGTRDGGGLGFELFYTLTADRDTVESGGVKVGDIGTSALGFYVLYKTPGEIYFKGKVGFAYIDFDVDVDSSASVPIQSEDGSGASYGAAVGMDVGTSGSVELSYLVLPKLDNVSDAIGELDVDMISLHYYWNF
jgi:hypothetical protein